MKKSLLSSLAVLATTTALMTATVPSASADDTTVTFGLSGGAISVAAQPTAAWGNKGSSGATSVVGQLGAMTVTDNRGGTTGWSVGASRTAFDNAVADDPATTEVDETAAATTTATAVSYNSGIPTFTGAVVATSRGATTLTATPAQVVSGTLVLGNNTATWNPTLTVTLPESSTAGNYAGTVTTSLL